MAFLATMESLYCHERICKACQSRIWIDELDRSASAKGTAVHKPTWEKGRGQSRVVLYTQLFEVH